MMRLTKAMSMPRIMSRSTGAKPSLRSCCSRPLPSHWFLNTRRAFDCPQMAPHHIPHDYYYIGAFPQLQGRNIGFSPPHKQKWGSERKIAPGNSGFVRKKGVQAQLTRKKATWRCPLSEANWVAVRPVLSLAMRSSRLPACTSTVHASRLPRMAAQCNGVQPVIPTTLPKCLPNWVHCLVHFSSTPQIICKDLVEFFYCIVEGALLLVKLLPQQRMAPCT